MFESIYHEFAYRTVERISIISSSARLAVSRLLTAVAAFEERAQSTADRILLRWIGFSEEAEDMEAIKRLEKVMLYQKLAVAVGIALIYIITSIR